MDTDDARYQSDSTDWNLCALCQRETKEKLQCPASATQKTQGSTYVSLAENLAQFHQLGHLPEELISRLGEGDLVDTFKKRKACFHVSCRLKYNSTKLKRKSAAASPSSKEGEPRNKFLRKDSDANAGTDDVCFLCDQSGGKDLRNASTFKLDDKLRKCALFLQDEKLLAKLSAGDIIAQELKYHPACLTRLYRKAQPLLENDEPQKEQMRHGLVFAELTEYMQEVRDTSSGDQLVVFRLADLARMYHLRLKDFGIVSGRVHSGRLKTRLLAHFPDLQAHTSGRDVMLTFADDIASTLKEIYTETCDDEAVHLAKAARIVRRDLFLLQSEFTGSYDEHCQHSSVPETLVALMEMILQGPCIDAGGRHKCQAALTLAQLATFNAAKTEGKRARQNTSASRHSKERETPLPVYVGMTIHAHTRKKELVDSMYTLGLSVSYSRVLEISSELARKACLQFEKDGAVCPMKLRFGLFTTAAVDNLDHNPSSTTAKDSFHGTAISLFQHPTESNTGEERTCTDAEPVASQALTVPDLPKFYSDVPPFALKLPVQPPSHENVHDTDDTSQYGRAVEITKCWLETVETAVNGQTPAPENVSWGAYHATAEDKRSDRTPGISSLLPLFHEPSKSPAMMKHAFDVVKKAVNFLNPGQNAVIACDQPLFALAKQIQWKHPELYGENKMTIMLGGLHTEMAFLKAIGTLLRDSGWTDILVQAGVATTGVADSFLSAAHVTRTRHAHQLTVCALSKLMKMAFEQYQMSCEIVGETPMSLDEWKTTTAASSPTFHFWCLIMDLQVLLLVFLSALRNGDFRLYLQSMKKMAPVFFALDHQNYARWLPVHIKDMMNLHIVEYIFQDFQEGRFVLQKSERPFSKLALDHAHEQNNALVKGDGGAVGLTDNPSALRRWMISGPEVARVVREFETSLERSSRDKMSDEHHEQSPSFQANFRDDVSNLVAVIQEAGNPFSERTTDFITLQSKDIISPAAHDAMKELLAVGGQQFETFFQERLVTRTKKLSDPITRNNVVLIAGAKGKRKGERCHQISSLKQDCHLFSRLYIGCQTRSGGLDDFFMYENQATPPSLSSEGKLRLASKSSLLECLESLHPPQANSPDMDVLIVDGAALVNMIRPGPAKTFRSYAENVFLPFVTHMLQNVSRLDFVWDVYRADSLKSSARDSRGAGKRRRVTADTVIPPNWNSFLRVGENKRELFNFLAQCVITVQTSKVIITTQGSVALSNCAVDFSNLSPCTHEEADSRMMVHLSHAAKDNKKIGIRTVDTDVVVLAVTAASHHPAHEVWIAMGTGKDFRHIPAHHIAQAIGPEKSCCLPMFHSFTGCDTVSFFNGIGKKKAWDMWQLFGEVTETFLKLSTPPFELTAIDRAVLERYVVLLYDKTSNCLDVNSARRHLFSQKRRQIENIPPTSEALLQHMKRAIYQGGFIWSQMGQPTPTLPDPAEWGWQFDTGKWKPFWTSLPEASSMCRELLKCGCKKSCRTKRCKCHKAGLKCTALCNCVCTSVKTVS